MLKNILIIAMCFVAVYAAGEFSILSSPKSLSFKGNEPLRSDYIGDLLSVCLGNPVAGDAEWTGLTIKDPFNLAKGIIAVTVDGVSHISVNSEAKTYEIEGSNSDESLNALRAELEASNVPICDIDFKQFNEAVIAFHACFGNIDAPVKTETRSLNANLHTADKELLQTVAYIRAASENLITMEKASNVLIIRLSLEPIAKAHGEKSDALAEATKLVSSAINKLSTNAKKSSNNDALVVSIANKYSAGRVKRATNNSSTDLNLAEYYNEDYPVIFNIILWFMVVFGLSLVAISYAIGAMDPGRDSIIYRMTSTRMKKDN